MSLGLLTRGYYGSGGGAGGLDTTPPIVTIVSLPVADTDPLVVSISDESGFSFYTLTCLDKPDGSRLVMYSPSDGFIHPFTGKSTVTGIGTLADPLIFTVYRRGRWPTGVDLNVLALAVDVGGNKVQA